MGACQQPFYQLGFLNNINSPTKLTFPSGIGLLRDPSKDKVFEEEESSQKADFSREL